MTLITPKSTQSKAAQISRIRNREATTQELRHAMLRVKNSGKKISITAVAHEAGVAPSLIHNTYPNIAEDIRSEVGRTVRQQRDTKAAELAEARESIRDLKKTLMDANSDIAKLASINETLKDEISRLKALAAGKLIILPSRVDK